MESPRQPFEVTIRNNEPVLHCNGLFPLVSAGEGLISSGFWLGRAGLGSFQVVLAGFQSFRFLVITVTISQDAISCFLESSSA